MSTLRWVDVAGCAALAGCLIHTVLSWFLSAGHGYAIGAGFISEAYFSDLAAALGMLPPGLKQALATGGPFADPKTLSLAYSAPLVVQTICAGAAVWAVRRAKPADLADGRLSRRIFLWAGAFAIASVPAFNVLTDDIWLSIPWGRMALAGEDPYLSAFAPALAKGTPLEYEPIAMTYGPLWAVVSALAVALSGNLPTLAWFILKLVLLGGWLAVLKAVATLSAGDLPRQAYALALCGWLPAGFHAVVAEGHNDGVMIGLFLFWLVWMARGGARGPLAFLAGGMTKYVIAPVVIVDAIYHLRADGMSFKQYLMRAVPAILIALPLTAYLLSGGRLQEMMSMKDWHFLAPYDLLVGVEAVTGLALPKLWITRFVFGGIAAWSVYQLWKNPDKERVWLACLCVMAALLFSAVGHVWPWFYVWVLPLAALIPASLMSRFILGACVVAPFSILPYTLPQFLLGPGVGNNSVLVSACVYGAAFALLGATLVHRYLRNRPARLARAWRQ